MTRTLTASSLAGLSADEVLALWAAANRIHEARLVDPELREAMLARLDDLDDRHLAEQIRAELDGTAPGAVLAGHWREVVPNRPALGAFRGAFPRRDSLHAPVAAEWYTEDPDRLRYFVAEVATFTKDPRRLAEAALQLAEDVGIPSATAEPIIAQALRDLKGGGRRAG